MLPVGAPGGIGGCVHTGDTEYVSVARPELISSIRGACGLARNTAKPCGEPPYNSGARDWKYNNDYVEKDDGYRHSKWLAFMERRLKIARDLLNPNNSVLIVTIDDKEVNRLGLLLEQLFPDGRIEMVTTVINGRGKYRKGEFARCEEYVYFIAFGKASVQGEPDTDFDEGATVPWRTLRRSDINSARGTAKGGTSQFFPIYVDDG